MSRFKVAIFTGNYNHIKDGVSLTLNRLVAFLMKRDVEVLVFGPTISRPALRHTGTLVAVPSVKLPGRPEYRVSAGFPSGIRKKAEEFDPDIVHIATPDLLGYKALKWALKRDKPVVASYHTHFSSYLKYYKLSVLEPLMWKYLAWFYEKCIQVYVPSPSMIGALEQKKIESDFRIWARGIDATLFHPSKRSDAWRAEHHFSPDDIVVTFVSRLVWEKKPDLFAGVVNRLRKVYPHVKGLIVGDGPAAEGIKELIPDAVFTGFLEGGELATAYASSDIFFFPSDTETFGNVTLEAMACGLPCVVANATGSKSLVEHGQNGYLAPVQKTDKFYTLIETLIVDEKLRRKMGQASLEKAKRFSWDAVNERLLDYYHEILPSKQ